VCASKPAFTSRISTGPDAVRHLDGVVGVIGNLHALKEPVEAQAREVRQYLAQVEARDVVRDKAFE
jgi:hypothetical protein